MNTLLQEAGIVAKAAQAIFAKAQSEGRDMTPAETTEFKTKAAEAHELKARHERGERPGQAEKQRDAEIAAMVADMFKKTGGAPRFDNPNHRDGAQKAWALEAADRLTKAMPQVDGQKSIVSGSVGVPNVIDPDIVSIGKVPTSLLDLLVVKGAESDGSGGNTFTFLRQTVRTNNAAVVADNATKPTSVYTMEEIEDRFRVIAHLSEAIPLRYFDDHSQLRDWLESEMDYGLRRALEAEILAGDGTGEHFTGILETSGILEQAFVSDLFTTTRKAKTALTTQGQSRPRSSSTRPTTRPLT